jgi:alkylhydroperoxidase family enzyme
MEFGEESSGRNFRGPLPDDTGAQGPKSTAELPVASVAELAALRARELAEREKEAQDYLERARKAQEEGRLGVAKVYYQTAARKSSGRIREAALSALAVLNGSKDVGTADSSRLARQELQRGANDPLR